MRALFLLVSLAIASSADANFFGEEGVPQLTGLGALQYDRHNDIQNIAIQCANSTKDEECPDSDDLDLVVEFNGKKLSYEFEGSYGYFHLYYIVNFSGNPLGDLILLHSEGRGTSAASWYMDIIDIENGKLVQKYKKVIGGFFGSGEQWWYSVHFDDQRKAYNACAECSTINLELHHSSFRRDPLEDVSIIPKDTKITIYWNRTAQKYAEVNQ